VVIVFIRRKKPSNLSLSLDNITVEGGISSSQFRRSLSVQNLNRDEFTEKYVIPFSALEFGDILGEGHFGSVFKGKYVKTSVAIKKLKNFKEKDRESFISEAKLMSLLTPHHNVVLFRGVTLDPLCILTDFCEGGSLRRFLSSPEKIDEEQQFKWIEDIAKGMAHLHNGVGEKKVILLHRDLAARNILLKHDTAQVSDFGMALPQTLRENSSIDALDEYVPVKWMAPEALLDNTFSTKTDVYSFGVVIWEIVSRSVPWKGIKLKVILEKVVNKERIPIPSNCPESLRILMEKCWRHDPNERPEFTEICDFLHEEEYGNRNNILSDQTVEVHLETRTEELEIDPYYNNQKSLKKPTSKASTVDEPSSSGEDSPRNSAPTGSSKSKLLDLPPTPKDNEDYHTAYVSYVSTKDLLHSTSNRANNEGDFQRNSGF